MYWLCFILAVSLILAVCLVLTGRGCYSSGASGYVLRTVCVSSCASLKLAVVLILSAGVGPWMHRRSICPLVLGSVSQVKSQTNNSSNGHAAA